MPQVGQSLNNRYQLIEPLGENANQQTWVARDRAQPSQENVVVKLLAMDPQMQWERAKLLEREAQILQQLNHPQIPQYRDYFLLEQLSDSRFPWFCLVQSQVPANSLQQLLEQGRRFTQAEVEKIAIEVLQILVYLHGLHPPVVHRDIKPSNLIWGMDNHLYLIDFGPVQDQAALEGATFTIVGTYGYTPMEQFGGQAVPASDLYALGASLIHLLTGVAPAELPHHNNRIQFANQVSLEPGLVNWVSQLSAPDLAERFPTARLALDALAHRETLSLPMVNHQPIGSQIRLKKSVNYLEINIPARGWQAISWLELLGYCCAGVFMLAGIAYFVLDQTVEWDQLALTVICLISIAFPALVQTKILGDRTHFTFYWKLFGIPVALPQF